MKSFKLALLYGFLVWLIPFIVAVLIDPLRATERPFFESIMPVVITVCVVIFSILYFKKVEHNFLREGIQTGIIYFAMGIGIDLLAFSWGPMAMSLSDYMKDIGFTYLMIPAITIGFGYLLMKRK
ncbi:MAG: hypothetical protein Q8O16_06600 [Dehalococcoidia bacterium]|nr:hypothetical protein [Dehalococcoidia bacterium]